MRFAFTDDQKVLHRAVRDLLADVCPTSVVRDATEDRPDGLWSSIVALDLPLGMVDDRDGGLGLDDVDLVGCFEAAGAYALPLPLVETVAVAAPLFSRLRDADTLDRIGRGEAIFTASLDGSGIVPWSTGSEVIVRADRALWWLAADTPLRSVASVDRSRPLHVLGELPESARLLTRDQDIIRGAWSRGVVATAAQLLGLAGTMLAMTVEFAKGREQFGVPIGSFQAVKHRLVDALVALEMARPVVYAAAWSLAVGDENVTRDCAAAKAMASDAATTVARAALQCHGAIGYTTEYDLHLFMKRAWALASSWGTADSHRRTLAGELGFGYPTNEQ